MGERGFCLGAKGEPHGHEPSTIGADHFVGAWWSRRRALISMLGRTKLRRIMESACLKLVLAASVAMVIGCDRKTDSDAVLIEALHEPMDIPEDWAQISLSRSEVDGVLNLTLSGKKKSLKEVMQTVGESLSKARVPSSHSCAPCTSVQT